MSNKEQNTPLTGRETLHKGKRRTLRRGWLVLALMLAVTAVVVLLLRMNRPEEKVDIPTAITYGEVSTHEAGEVARIEVTLRSGENWAICREGEEETFHLEGDPDWLVAEDMQASLLRVAAVISYDRILSETNDFHDHDLAEFGLDHPRAVVDITYTDGERTVMRIGNGSAMEDETWSYMQLEGDERLFALDGGTADAFSIEQALLHPVTQPVIHKARLCGITLQTRTQEASWALQGKITDQDAMARWRLVAPVTYPADPETMESLCASLSNIRLGAYVAPDTPENRAKYGFENPRLSLTLHMAEGVINGVDESGSVVPITWPDSTLTLLVGDAQNEYVDYVLVGDSICLTSHFAMASLMELEAFSTLSRYPVAVAMDALKSLTITRNGERVVYAGSRWQQTSEEGVGLTDAEGNILYEGEYTRNGEKILYETFAAAYARLETVRVSGRLPEGWQPTEDPHTTYLFQTNTGISHQVALTPFDALHDAVVVDGTALFYLVKGGMVW